MHAMGGSSCTLINACAFFLGALLLVQESWAGNVLEFDGINDRVLVPYDDSFPTEVFTLSAWIKLTPPGHRSAIIARGEDDDSFNLSWQLYVNPDGMLQIMLENRREQNFCYPLSFSGRPQSSCSAQDLRVADDQWHHVAATRELSGRLGLYIDGESCAQCDQTGVPSSNNFQFLSIGCTFGTVGPPPGGVEPPTWFFPGAIDDPAVWNVALSQSDLRQVYADGVDPADEHLIGFWPFEEGVDQSVADLSAAGNHGFLGAEPSSDAADPLWKATSTDPRQEEGQAVSTAHSETTDPAGPGGAESNAAPSLFPQLCGTLGMGTMLFMTTSLFLTRLARRRQRPHSRRVR